MNKIKFKCIVAALTLIAFFAVDAGAGAPPTVMFLPDKAWCTQNGYIETFTGSNGKVRKVEKFEEAFTQDPELKNVIKRLDELMQNNGLKPLDFESSTENADDEEMEEEAYNEDSQSGGTHDVNSYEALLNRVRPDIAIRIGWDKHVVGFNYSLTYRIDAKDAYTGKSVATIVESTQTLNKITPINDAILNAATEYMDAFVAKLQDYFDDIQENGREITVTCNIGNNGTGLNFNSEFGGKELSIIISEWFDNNTVNHNYSKNNTGSRNKLKFTQVRIPLKNAKGGNMDAKDFVDQLKHYLRDNYKIKSENTTKGLGSGRLYDICL